MNTVDFSLIACVTVTYNPDFDLLSAQLRSLPQAAAKIVVDNASSPSNSAAVAALVGDCMGARLLHNEENLGLAAALNQGVRAARIYAPNARYALLLDQDSEPQMGSIAALLSGFEQLQEAGERVGCVGPILQDAETGLSHGFHQQTRWRWRRVYPDREADGPVQCANLNGSGTLVPIDLFIRLGGLDESLFIDHVDTEWSFRVLAAGYTLWGIPQAVFRHRMGQASIRFWMFGWRLWPSRSAQRHYYLYRNAVWLMRRDYVSRVWKFWAMPKLLITLVMTLVFDPQRFAQLSRMTAGLRDAVSKAKSDSRSSGQDNQDAS